MGETSRTFSITILAVIPPLGCSLKSCTPMPMDIRSGASSQARKPWTSPSDEDRGAVFQAFSPSAALETSLLPCAEYRMQCAQALPRPRERFRRDRPPYLHSHNGCWTRCRKNNHIRLVCGELSHQIVSAIWICDPMDGSALRAPSR
jgi:hypothetical protein